MRRRIDALVVAAAGLAVMLAHFRAIGQAPLVRYGFRGAEYLEHLQRQYAIDLAAGLSWGERMRRVPDHLALLDGQYPALLHVVAAVWGSMAGDSFAATAHLNLLFLALLAGGTAWLASELGGVAGAVQTPEAATSPQEPGLASPPRPLLSSPALAAACVLLLPAVFATARRYYYDLPLAAGCVLATAALLAGRRSGWAALLAGPLTALACLTKWQALLYLFPGWGLALVAAWRSGGARGRLGALVPLLVAGLSVPLLCWPVVRRSDLLAAGVERLLGVRVAAGLGLSIQGRHGSLDDALGQGSAALAAASGVGAKLSFYGRGVIESSIGPWLAAALLLCALLGWRGRRALGLGALLTLPSILVLVTRVRVVDERFLLPMLPVWVASIVVAWGSCRRPRAALAGAMLLLGAGGLQLLAVDGILSRSLAPRAPVQLRGWNRLGEAPPSPWQGWLEVARAACPAAGTEMQGGGAGESGKAGWRIGVAEGLSGPDADLYGWRWALLRGCPGAEVEGLEAVLAGSASGCRAVLSDRPLEVTGRAGEAGGLEPHRLEALRVEVPGGRPAAVWVYRGVDPDCP